MTSKTRVTDWKGSEFITRTTSCAGLLAIVTAGLLSGCVSTTVSAVWKDEAYTGGPHKALVILVARKPLLIRVFEDEFVRQLKARGVDAAPGYSLLPLDRKLEKEEIESAVKKTGADALFVTRLVDKQSFETYYPGSVYATHVGPPARGWGGFYARGYTSYQATPGYTVQQNVLHVETQLYDTNTEQLIWSAMTETLTGGAPESEVKDFVKVIMKSLTEKRLVAGS
jgi:hypothetical protein